MFELALVNKIQELSAWKCLGAQCFLWGCDHWGWGQSLPFSTGVGFGATQVSHEPAECPVTLQGGGTLFSSIDGMVMCLGLFLNPQDTATCGKLWFFPCSSISEQGFFFIQYQLRRVLWEYEQSQLGPIGPWGPFPFRCYAEKCINFCLWTVGTNIQWSTGKPCQL